MGKLVSQVSVNWKGDVFQIFQFPSPLSNISPNEVHSVDLLAGHWGTVGSILLWNYNHEGRNKVAKEMVEAVDEKKKTITYKVIEGDLMQAYNQFKIKIDVNSINENEHIVTWSMDYEKKSEEVPDPTSLMEAGLALTKQIEHHPIMVAN